MCPLGIHQVDEAAENLIRIRNKLEMKPTLLCVICGMSNACYKRPDGVYVVPITALKH
jgi:uncharacterized protein